MRSPYPARQCRNNAVYLVQPDGTVTQRAFAWCTDGDRVSVEGDLQDGDQVVTDGIDRLREGAKVAVIDAKAAARATRPRKTLAPGVRPCWAA